MSYQGWIFDIGHEVDSALRVLLGQSLDENDFEPDPRVTKAIAEIAADYDVHYDRAAIAFLAESFGTMGVGFPDGNHINIGRVVRARFDKAIQAYPMDDSTVFRWFIANANKLNLGIADGEKIRLAYDAYWSLQFAAIMAFIVRHAMERDSEDDIYYDLESDGSFDTDE